MADWLTVEQALDHLRQQVKPVAETETVNLIAANGRVLASDQIAVVNVPPADNSAMDGFAFAFADLQAGGELPVTLPVSQRIPAGLAPEPLEPGSAARIFTGSEIPPGADTVVMQENCTYSEEGDQVIVHRAPSKGAGDNVRPCGQDIRSGEVLLKAGQRLRAPELGLLASVGIGVVPVYRRIKVAVVSTGDELVEPGDSLASGQIYNANRYLLAGLLQGLGAEVVDLGCAKDHPDSIEVLLRRAASEADCVLSSGGVSVGEEDHVKSVLAKLGRQVFWKIAVKPGKPLAFGHICDTPFFGLPGNPVSACVTFALFTRPYLSAMQGAGFVQPRRFVAKAGFDVAKPRRREEYLRANLEVIDGQLTAVPLANQSSGVLTSISRSDVLAVVPIRKTIDRGADVKVIPIQGLLN
ncbi:molybdopterin molybdotransferase MoeA [bacterium SCSIO 12696]|nr:molybdopterin molybdotransferase MoeA [bacterium SCSIO 12696]